MDFTLAYTSVLLHLISIVVWMGAHVFRTFAVIPALVQLPPEQQRPALRAVGIAGMRIFAIGGILALVFGALAGFGVRRYGEALGLVSRWGWAIALGAILSVVLVVTGTFVTGRLFQRLSRDSRLWEPGAEGLRAAHLARCMLAARLELIGAAIVLALMTLARFS